MRPVIWWIRRDLRLQDNQALAAACRNAANIVPLFVVDPFFERSPNVGERRRSFLWAGLKALDSELQARGSRLIVRRGDPAAVIPQVMAEVEATAVFAERDVSPIAQRRDARIGDLVLLHLLPGLTMHPPDAVTKKDGTPYTVFTPYMRRWKERPFPTTNMLIDAPAQIMTPDNIPSDPLPEVTLPAHHFPAGSAEARRRLAAFTEGTQAAVFHYGDRRDLPSWDGTSQLSPYLRFGMLSIRQAVLTAVMAMQRAASPAAKRGAETWLNELIWREFYQMILYHFPHVAQGSFRSEYDRIQWRNDEAEFEAWCNGRTGFPIVDAGMRQLNQTGWMHNRLRMITASFLVKDLLIDWRWGERWFMQQLVDGELAANNGGWQWTAGTGTDAAPYFRIFNPTSQGKKFDPNGDYIRRWVPEVAGLPADYIHEPAKLPPLIQQSHQFVPGQTYPHPLVNRKVSRQRALDAYKAARENK